MLVIIIIIIVITAVVIGYFFINVSKNETPTPEVVSDTPDTKMQTLKISSPAFEALGTIPSKYTCDGASIIPPLVIDGVPEGTASLVLIMDDPDIPESVKTSRGIDVFDHWVIFNIPPDTTSVKEGLKPEGVAGQNSSGKTGYVGPCPPDKEHRYFFKVYALDLKLNLPEGSTKKEIEKAMEGHIIMSGELVGKYNRISKI